VRAIDYPVAVDNDYAVWDAFDNNSWPALYFVDRDGILRDQHFGEGRTNSPSGRSASCSASSATSSPSKGRHRSEADWDTLRAPETYVGYGRGERFASPGGAASGRYVYELPERLGLNQWALAGEWTISHENVVLDETGGSIAFRFHARDAHLVLSTRAQERIPFRVLLDGAPPGLSHGDDADEEGNGELRDGLFYQLVRQAGEVRERTLEITFLAPGAEAYSFTFGLRTTTTSVLDLALLFHRVDHCGVVVVGVEDSSPLFLHPDFLGNTTRSDVVGVNDRDQSRQPKASERQVASRHRGLGRDSLVPRGFLYVPADFYFRTAVEGQGSDAAVPKEV
jgi:hypothetical protein